MKKLSVYSDVLRPTYHVWVNMKSRCSNPNVYGYDNYGGRGIKVCARWQQFKNFLADMGVKPPGLTLERVDNDGDYEPSNCVWASRREQALNRRRTVWVEHNGLRLCVKDWAKHLGVSINSFRSRAKVRGSYAEAIASYDDQPLRRLKR
jgi:hypothetical protein